MKKFNYRSFVSITMAFSFIILMLTSLMLYVVPAGRVANWTNWAFMGMSKEQWTAVHTIFGYVFLGFGLFHILKYNLRPLLNYIKRKTQENSNQRKELLVSTVLVIAFTAGTIAGIPPFSTVMKIGGHFKESWVENKEKAPVAHAEMLTIRELAKTIDMEPEKIFMKLRDAGLKVKDGNQILDNIALENKMSPRDVYAVIKKGEQIKESDHEPGLGMKTLKQVCASLGISAEQGIEILKKNGITAEAKNTMREISAANNKAPVDIKNLLEKY